MMTKPTTKIPISSIILDEEIYPRKGIDQKRVGIFAENIKDGFKFDPIEVQPHPDKPGKYRLLDGVHRWCAFKAVGMEEGVVGFVATHNQPLIVKDVLKEPRFKEKEMAKKLGLVSMVSLPLQVKDEKVIGVLNCFTDEPHEFSDTEINLVTAVANQAAVAILNTELMVKTKVIREELETRKLVERAKEILIAQTQHARG